MNYIDIDRSFKKKISDIVQNVDTSIPFFTNDNNPTNVDTFVHCLGTINMTDILYTEHKMLLSIYTKKDTDEQRLLKAFTDFLQTYSFEVYNYSATSEKIGSVVFPNWQIESAGYNENGYKVTTLIVTLKYKEVIL